MKLFGWGNVILVVILIAAIGGVAFFSVFHNNFKDVPSTLNFLDKANVYNNVSTIVRLEIEDRYPPLFRNNAILNSIANRAVSAIVTPKLIERAATPALKASVAFAAQPTSIINDKVVVATAGYKAQAKQAIENLGLPKILVVNVNFIVDSVPAHLTVVDVKKHPNSPLVWIIKARTLLKYNHTAMNISWIVLFASLVVLFIHNLSNIKRLFLAAWIAFMVGGLSLIVKSLAIPHILSMFLPQGGQPGIVAQNSLVMDAISYLLSGVRIYGVIFTVLGLVILVAWKYCDFTHFQKTLDKRLAKVHLPEVEVRVKT